MHSIHTRPTQGSHLYTPGSLGRMWLTRGRVPRSRGSRGGLLGLQLHWEGSEAGPRARLGKKRRERAQSESSPARSCTACGRQARVCSHRLHCHPQMSSSLRLQNTHLCNVQSLCRFLTPFQISVGTLASAPCSAVSSSSGLLLLSPPLSGSGPSSSDSSSVSLSAPSLGSLRERGMSTGLPDTPTHSPEPPS